MNPVDTTNAIRDFYISYLTTQFGYSESLLGIVQGEPESPSLNDRFAETIRQRGILLKGPFLEATAPYESSTVTVRQLVADNILCPEFAQLFEEPVSPITTPNVGFFNIPNATPVSRRRVPFPADRPLYIHQEAAIRRLAAQDIAIAPHTVVASGTGSGKTECFLLPIIDWIFRHPTRGDHPGKGIRALLVYPMNALVNDQVRRLTELVGYWEGDIPLPITFAKYTSETENEKKEKAQQREPRAPKNQLLTRQEIIRNPPDILITNFAMLEQALLRPQEDPFFMDFDDFAWRFIVLDEAHSYRGTQAIELARMFQRVRAAIQRDRRRSNRPILQPICVATSATLADPNQPENERKAETAKFVRTIFGFDEDNPNVVNSFPLESVIFTNRIDPAQDQPCH